MRLKFYLTVFFLLLFGCSAWAQDDFVMPGEIAPRRFPVETPDSPFGWKWRFQMGGHYHLARESFWDNTTYSYGRGTQVWLSWDLGLVRLDEHLNGWGGGVFAWLGGDYEGALGLKGYRRWSLGPQNQSYFQFGPGVIPIASSWDRSLRHPGYLLEFEIGCQDLAFSTSVTFLPFKDERGHWDLVGDDFVYAAGEQGLDVAWSTGMKLEGLAAGLSTSFLALIVILTFHRVIYYD